MKKAIFSTIIILFSLHCFAQQQLAFPFQGGNKAMMQFFKDSLQISQSIEKSKITGTVVFKFTADAQGNIKNLVIWYADDALLAQPAVEALKKSNRKWIIPDNEKIHDFIIPFIIRYQAMEDDNMETQNALHSAYARRKPIVARDQIPLNEATLLPAVTISYKEEGK
jgi:hypothetical protein